MEIQEDIILVSEAADAIGRSPAWVYKLIQEGKIRSFTSEIDKRVKVSLSEIRQKLEPKPQGGN